MSGHEEALQQVQPMAAAEGALRVALPAVSGAVHTPLMQTAQVNLQQASQWLTHKFAIPLCYVCAAGAQALQSMDAEKHASCKREALPNACMLQGLHVCADVCHALHMRGDESLTMPQCIALQTTITAIMQGGCEELHQLWLYLHS